MTQQPNSDGWSLDHSYTTLPEVFYSPAIPTVVREPKTVIYNAPLAQQLGIHGEALLPNISRWFSGNAMPPGARPIAQAYAGHQFGHFTMLGDGRAILLGEQLTPEGECFDIQLKGAGQTPYSRRGDGRAALGPMLREYLISEAMAALGIPTTRSLAVVTTGEPVYRESVLEGAVLTRVASSHIRVGTFEYAAYLHHGYQQNAGGHPDALRALSDYTIARHYPEILQACSEEPRAQYLGFLEAVMLRQAKLVAQWMGVGFIHGVMNTDNMAISGETIDYGPCAFMDAYDPATVFSSIDHQGRYAYGNQPAIAQWNLARFAEALIPLLAPDQEEGLAIAQEAVGKFREYFHREWVALLRQKLGLLTSPSASPQGMGDEALVEGFLDWMALQNVDFTNGFRMLCYEEFHTEECPRPLSGVVLNDSFWVWYKAWKARVSEGGHIPTSVLIEMRNTNPAVIPRNHLVEEALLDATENHELSKFHQLMERLARPFEGGNILILDPSQADPFQGPPPPSEIPYKTFCGT